MKMREERKRTSIVAEAMVPGLRWSDQGKQK